MKEWRNQFSWECLREYAGLWNSDTCDEERELVRIK